MAKPHVYLAKAALGKTLRSQAAILLAITLLTRKSLQQKTALKGLTLPLPKYFTDLPAIRDS